MVKLDMQKGPLRFHQNQEGLVHVQLPQWLTDQKIPDDARLELQNYFNHIKNKYGL